VDTEVPDIDTRNTVLIIDDEKANIIALTHILSSDYKIYAAKSGRDGIELASNYMPDVILLDIRMPGMDGYETLSCLKYSEKTQKIPVIFITGLSNRGDEEKGLSFGAADYITKPFSTHVVKMRVENQIKMINQLRMIEKLSMTDQLTGIPNRRSFDIRLRSEWKRTLREKMPISIMMLDIDFFKKYNDDYGHQQGDIALQSFARALYNELKRPGDFSARWGGEEFAALLTNTDSAGALDVAEQIRKSIEEMDIYHDSGLKPSAAKLTVSIGVNTSEHSNRTSIDDFISKADEALYRAKNQGRNRVCLFE